MIGKEKLNINIITVECREEMLTYFVENYTKVCKN